MNQALKKARTRLTILTICVAILCALVSVIGTYVIADQRMTQSINAVRLGQLAKVNPELSAYIDSQEAYSAHFDSIAQIVQREDRRQLLSALPVVFVSVFAVSSILGWLLAQKLLEPVNEAYVVQRRFMQDAAHELRNPLAAMKTIIQQTKPPKSNKQLATRLQSLSRQTDHLINITTDLLLLERSEQRATKLVDVVPLLQDVAEELHYKARSKNIKVFLKTPETLQAAILPSHFIAITKNLLDNSIKFSPTRSGVVEVDLVKRASGLRLKIKDNGVGIKKSEQKYITNRFYRASNSIDIEGTGLGLAIVSKYVDLYHGNLSISSAARRGTTVIIDI